MKHKIVSLGVSEANGFIMSTEHLYASFLYKVIENDIDALKIQDPNTETKLLDTLVSDLIAIIQRGQKNQKGLSKSEKSLLNEKLDKIRESYIEYCNKSGYSNLYQLLALALKPTWRSSLNTKTSELITQNQRFVTPSNFCLLSNTDFNSKIDDPVIKKNIKAGFTAFNECNTLIKQEDAGLKAELRTLELYIPYKDGVIAIAANVNDKFYGEIKDNKFIQDRLKEINKEIELLRNDEDSEPKDKEETLKQLLSLVDKLNPDTKQLTKKQREKLEEVREKIETSPLPDEDFTEKYLSNISGKTLYLKSVDEIIDELRDMGKYAESLIEEDEELLDTFFEKAPIDQYQIIHLLTLQENYSLALDALAEIDELSQKEIIENLPPTLRHALQFELEKQDLEKEISAEKTEDKLSKLENFKREILGKSLSKEAKKWALQEIESLTKSLKSPSKEEDSEEDSEDIEDVRLADLEDNRELELLPKDSKKTNETRMKRLELLANLPIGRIDEFTISTYDTFGVQSLPQKVLAELDKIEPGQAKIKKELVTWVMNIINHPKQPIRPLVVIGPESLKSNDLVKKAVEIGLGIKSIALNLKKIKKEAEIFGNEKKPGKLLEEMVKANSQRLIYVIQDIDEYTGESKEEGGGISLAALFGGGKQATQLNFDQLVDTEENSKYEALFLPDAPIDMSKTGIVITTKSDESISSGVMDKAFVIEAPRQSRLAKIKAGSEVILPQILEEKGLKKHDILMSYEMMSYLLDSILVHESGKYLKSTLEFLVDELSHGSSNNFYIPCYQTTKEDIDNVIKKMGWKNMLTPMSAKPMVGQMMALAAGDGIGITSFIQVGVRSENANGRGRVINTGKLGDYERESNETAFTVAGQILKEFLESKGKQITDYDLEMKDTQWESDGPSASALVSTTMMSAITGIPIKNTIATTGELNLTHKIGPIGGLFYKLQAAKQSGVSKVYICEANREDFEKAIKDDPELIEAGVFEVKIIERVEQLAYHALDWEAVKNDQAAQNLKAKLAQYVK